MPTPDWFIDRALGDAITMLSRLHQRSPHKGKAASFHVHRTDGDGEWLVRLGAEGALNMGAYQDLASHRPLARGGGLGGS